ncbi:hypothetical protein PSm6_48080 [Pseudomonas solani]|uniref:Uncharacterized protein n=1 Tax=Pseudomonas solani TaxID=2731552 RepID=A0ABM7LFJ5_9PSED|nr:hypothetical protein PSm6_48080 [Pseudomonas solani]
MGLGAGHLVLGHQLAQLAALLQLAAFEVQPGRRDPELFEEVAAGRFRRLCGTGQEQQREDRDAAHQKM